VPTGNKPSLAKDFDMTMLVSPGGIERTEEEYRVSVLFAARRGDSTQEKGYTLVNARDDVDLIRKTRWNDIQKYAWEINPAYRDFLLAVRRKDNLGLSLRGSKRRWT
jgi:hypothetical protein